MSANKFLIKCAKRGYFKSGSSGSMWYNETDFVKTEYEAQHYMTEDRALRTAYKLIRGENRSIRFDISVLPITISIVIEDGIDASTKYETAVNKKLSELTVYVNRIKSLSHEDTDALSKKEWKKFIEAKQYVSRYK